MGCLTGFRLLNIARQIAEADPNARILVLTADLRSALGNSLPKKCSRKDIVSIALFTDSASAAIVGGSSNLQTYEQPTYQMISGLSRVLGDDHTAVNYFEDDDGSIRLHLAKNLPDLIACHDEDFVHTLLEKSHRRTNLKIPPLSSEHFDVLCHTGGPRVLREVQQSLHLERSDFSWSWDVMQSHGNLSGASNLCVLDHHNRHIAVANGKPRSSWAICLSMGPGPCLESVLLKCLHPDPTRSTVGVTTHVMNPSSPISHIFSHDSMQQQPLSSPSKTKRTIHIVGGGIAGMALAATLDPNSFQVHIFEASPQIEEKSYGLVIGNSTLRILIDKLGIEGLNYFSPSSMEVRVKSSSNFRIPLQNQGKDKGFMSRHHLLSCLADKVRSRHGSCVSTKNRCVRVKFQTNGPTQVTYESGGLSAVQECDLLIGADGINSVVRKYVALRSDCRQYGSLTAYRFMVPNPSDKLLKETQSQWNMSIGEHIHSPCYHVSKDGTALSVVVLEYEGRPPSHPRPATMKEHIDCEPWHNKSAAIIGDAAHAYGPLTAKMTNLAINDAYTLGMMLNKGHRDGLSQSSILRAWEDTQRPKFEVTRLRTKRHLQLYTPQLRFIVNVLWKVFPSRMLRYFGSIFAYDYDVDDFLRNRDEDKFTNHGVIGIKYMDPLTAVFQDLMKVAAQLTICYVTLKWALLQFCR